MPIAEEDEVSSIEGEIDVKLPEDSPETEAVVGSVTVAPADGAAKAKRSTKPHKEPEAPRPDINLLIEQARAAFQTYPFDILPVDDVKAKVREAGLPSFIDIDFPPLPQSIYPLDNVDKKLEKLGIVWKRPREFMKADAQKGLEEPQVFYKSIEPNDIAQGGLGDCWFMCSVSSLAEKPFLVERLFLTQEYNEEGIYRVKICKNGEWVEVTLDDYFPCKPEGGPIFSRAHGNELWVLLIEKAYAKVHGCYVTLR